MATLVIEVTPELESRLREEAAKRGLEPLECARELLEGVLQPQNGQQVTPPLTPQERAARVKAVKGKYAHVRFSTEDLFREKQEEIAREEQRWERRFG